MRMRVFNVASIPLIAMMFAACTPAAVRRETSEDCHYRTVSFPEGRIRTDLAERIEAVEVVMHCGRFVAINHIPDDWSAHVASPVSEETSLNMEAGHGSSMLWQSSDLNEFTTVLACESSGCFDIAGSLGLYYYDGEEHERKIAFTQSELILKPLPNDASQPTPKGARLDTDR
jgi:hypothetical protein